MRRIKLVVAYDGTEYCGFQVQNNGYFVTTCDTRKLFCKKVKNFVQRVKKIHELRGVTRVDFYNS